MMYYGYGPMYDFWNPLQALSSLIIVLAVAFAVIYFVRAIREQRAEMPGRGSALDILNERYAKGELTKEQYESMKADIQK